MGPTSWPAKSTPFLAKLTTLSANRNVLKKGVGSAEKNVDLAEQGDGLSGQDIIYIYWSRQEQEKGEQGWALFHPGHTVQNKYTLNYRVLLLESMVYGLSESCPLLGEILFISY